MIQRGWVFLLFVSLLTPLFAYDTQALSQDSYWRKLLHFRDGKSEIDSLDFFLSPKGKTDPKAELEATLEALHHDKDVFCRFPARVAWLYEKIPSLEGYQSCEALEDLIVSYDASKAVLIFPTAHINSPASMFGHTFLRLDDKKGLALTANAVNYAAKTAESNGLVFAYEGLFGGYEGRYSVLPYYKKIKEYNNLERRDIWEYGLNLDETELRRLLLHLYELKDSYADYFFFTENCSYNLLWLLEVARSGVDLVGQFSIKAIPVDTIRAVQEAGLIDGVEFRPSKTKRIRALLESSKRAKGEVQKAYQAELDVELLQLKRTQNKIDKKRYIHTLMQLLAKRSALPTLPKLEIKRPSNPLEAHQTTRLEVGVGKHKAVEFGFKLAFHDIYDVDRGFIQGAYIDFFHLKFRKNAHENVTLDNLNLVNINSYAPRDSIFTPLSWGVNVGAERYHDRVHFRLAGEVGYTYGLGENTFGFMMLKPSLYLREDAIWGIAPKFGVLANFASVKLGLQGERNLYSDGERNLKVEAFSTIMISKNAALNFKANHDKIGASKSTDSMGVSLFYYF